MTDVRFYHLTRSRLEDTLPVMLQRTLQREARAVVRFATRLKALEVQAAGAPSFCVAVGFLYATCRQQFIAESEGDV